MPLTITILGAGISGLTAALALRQQGHHVTLLEKAATLQEAGAAIHLGPNCSGILHRLGMKPLTVGANLLTGMAQYTGGGAVRMKSDLTETNKQWANPWFLIHRVDLHRELKRLALDAAGDGPLPELHLGCMSVDMDVSKGIVSLTDGRTFHSDVIIGADGNFSFARKSIDPAAKPHPWGKACYRWLVPRQMLLDDPQISGLINEDGWYGEFSEADRRIVMYPCRSNSTMNFAAFVPNAEADAGSGDWDEQGNRVHLFKAFGTFFPGVQKLLSYVPEDVRVWKLYDMETLPSWTTGRVALIGDAAHPFIPFLGQGGAMAIEDAASIAQVLPQDTPVDEIPDRLKLYEQIRQGRVTWVQEQTRINGLDEDKRPATKGGLVMLKYCHNYDEWENSQEKLQEWLRDRPPTDGIH